MFNFHYREGESLEEAYGRMVNERSQWFQQENERQLREKEMEDRLYNRLVDRLTNTFSILVKNEASPIIQELKKELENLGK